MKEHEPKFQIPKYQVRPGLGKRVALDFLSDRTGMFTFYDEYDTREEAEAAIKKLVAAYRDEKARTFVYDMDGNLIP